MRFAYYKELVYVPTVTMQSELNPYVWPVLLVHSKKLTGEGSWNYINYMVELASVTANLINYAENVPNRWRFNIRYQWAHKAGLCTHVSLLTKRILIKFPINTRDWLSRKRWNNKYVYIYTLSTRYKCVKVLQNKCPISINALNYCFCKFCGSSSIIHQVGVPYSFRFLKGKCVNNSSWTGTNLRYFKINI